MARWLARWLGGWVAGWPGGWEARSPPPPPSPPLTGTRPTCRSRGSRDHHSWVTRSLGCTSPTPHFSLSSALARRNSRRSQGHERVLVGTGSTPGSFPKATPLRTVVHGVQTKTKFHLFLRRHKWTSSPAPLLPFAKLGKNIPLPRARSFCFKDPLQTRLLPFSAKPRASKVFLYRKRYRVVFHYIRYPSLTISLQRNAIADPPWQNPHSQDIDIKRGKEVKLSCETSLFVVAPRTFGGGMATTWLLPLSHK